MKMNRKLSLMAAVLICGLMCNTCDLFKDMVKAPELSLKSVDFTKIDFNGLTLLSKVDVRNDNSVDIPLPKIVWDLNIIDNPFVDGIIQSEGSLKSNNSTEVEFPVSFTYENLIKTIAALTDENAKYKINMIAHIPVPQLGNMEWPFSHEGKVPLMRIPDINVASAPKASITYGNSLISGVPGLPTGGKIDFSLNLKNASNVAVILNQLSCTLKINNTPLSLGLTDKPTIGAGATEKIDFSLPLTVSDITNIGLTLLTGGISSYSLTGESKFGIPDFPLIDKLLEHSFNLGN
jgi:LEA14-like dessication related protein